MTYYRGEKVGNATYISILNEGYPHNRLASLHLNTLEEGYYATKMALWMYILGATEADIGINPAYGSSDPAAKRVYDAAISIFKYGVSKASEGIQEPEILITADSPKPQLDSEEQYRQQIITINANKYVGTNPDANGFFKLAWADLAAVPVGTKIELPDGTDITSAMQVQAGASSISQIVVKYPINATEFTTQLTVTALLQGNDIYTAYYTGDEGDANMQRYLVEADPKKEISANFTATLSVEDEPPPGDDEPPPGDDEPPPEVPGTLRVVKLESGTLIPLAGAVFDIKDPDGVTLYSMATDVSGTISVPVAKEGYYTITERVAPRYHTLPTHTTQGVQVSSGETAIVTFEDNPYGSLTVYKKDSADGRNLSGAVIQIKNIATGVTQTATTDSSGSATFNQLPCAADGTGYEVRELTAPQGYALDATVHTVSVRPLSEGVTSYTLTNRANPGLRLLKLDRERAVAIPGVSFEVYRNGSLYGEYTTDFNGEIFLPNLPTGTYTAREKSSVEPYVLDRTAQWVELTAGGGIQQLIFLNSQKSGIYLVKLDSATLKPLPNAKFRFTQISGGSYNQELITDQNGEILLSHLAPGAYEVREISVPNGYLIDDSVRTIEILAGKPDARFVFTNSKKPSIEVVKYDAQNNKYLAGATFRIAKIEDGSHYLDRVTDVNGRIQIDDLEPGVYSVQEIAAPSGYVLNTTEYHVELFPGRTSQIVVVNEKKPSLIIKKYDYDTALPLPNAEFSVTTKGGVIVWQGVISGSAATVQLDNLDVGWYTVAEIAPPPGYLALTVGKDVFLGAGKTVEVKFDNRKKPDLLIVKTDAVTGEPVAGVTFDVRKTDTTEVKTVTSNAKGEALLTALDPGVWEIRERSVPDAYLIAREPVQSITLTPAMTGTVRFQNFKKPTLTINKVDSITGDPIKGAKFSVVYASNNTFSGEINDLGTFYTDAAGQIILPKLKDGWFRVTEDAPAPGYTIKMPATQEFYLEAGRDKAITFENAPKSAIIIRKIDSETGLPVPGATFTVRYLGGTSGSGGTIIHTGVTSINGTIVLAGLAPGTYVCEETRPAPGFELSNPSVQTAYVADDEQAVVQLTFSNAKMGHLVIAKKDSATKLPLAGVTFKVTFSDGAFVGASNGEYTTDAAGLIKISDFLPIGSTVVVSEIRCPDTHNMDAPAQTVKIAANTTHTLTFYDSPKSGAQIIKLDSVTKQPLKGAQFKVVTPDGGVVFEGETDGDGVLLLPLLEPGWYKAIETRSPVGYVLDDTPKDFEVTSNQFIKLVFENKPLAGLLITKYDSVTKRPLAGAVFEVKRADGAVFGATNGRYTTDRNGQVLIANVTPGDALVVTEVSAPQGYTLDGTPQTVAIGGERLYALTFYDVPRGGLQIVKSDTDGKPLANIEFAVERMNGERVGVFKTDSAGVITLFDVEGWLTVTETRADGYIIDKAPHNIEVKPGALAVLRLYNEKASGILLHKVDSVTGKGIYGAVFLLYDAGKNPLRQYTSDQDGFVYIGSDEQLAAGKYFLSELKPAPGYQPDDELKTVYIEAGKTAQITWKNTPITGQIQLVKYSQEYNSVTGAPVGTPLKGAVYEITQARSGAVVGYITTDARGVAASNPLPLGRYFLKEVTAPPYYQVNAERLEAELEYPGQIIRLAAYDKSAILGTEIRKTGNLEVLAGDSMWYSLSIANTSNVPLSDFYWSDRIPTDAARVQTLTTGTYNQRVYYRVMYRTNYGEWRTLKSNLLSTNNYAFSLAASALGLAAGEVVTEVKLEFGTVQAGFASVTKPTISVLTLATLPKGYIITNRAQVRGTYQGAPQESTAAWTTKVVRFDKQNQPNLPKTGY
ncbi:MAG: hypothetical protein LBN30_09635 [Oscillospiraceae bacterium]|nr:hypothetical protein [Oscillospiraceae bacterium]